MKVLIAIAMFLFGLFVGILIVPTFKEFSTSYSIEEEYSTPRVKSILYEFGITLPLETSDLNLFLKQDGGKKQVWVKFECSEEVMNALIEQLNGKHSGLFNREVETPKMFDGTPIVWWSFPVVTASQTSLRYYEFKDMCAVYDDLLRTFCLYAIIDGETPSIPEQQSGETEFNE